ncbi:PspC domain-containing protein [Andreprevotia chitinilytica]|uniref:PspC domain-containing protein n=1 Tax=Andreprevotia chitinilytica TaxID=396808 RepID=UPI000551207F|nr:PspC domain-containing protein [Andreprevotia chitinilytica]
MTTDKVLRRSRNNRWVGGVIGGLANYFDISADKLRLVYLLVLILSAAFPGLLVYLVLWFLMPVGDD